MSYIRLTTDDHKFVFLTDIDDQFARDLLQGVCDACLTGKYIEGNRNTIMVNLAFSCQALGINALEVYSCIKEIAPHVFDNDDEDTERRLQTCMDYAPSWSYMDTINHVYFSEIAEAVSDKQILIYSVASL